MIVAQLIAELQKLNPDTRVVVRGYEGGVNDVESFLLCWLEVDANLSGYFGQHEAEDTASSNYSVPAYQLCGFNKLAT